MFAEHYPVSERVSALQTQKLDIICEAIILKIFLKLDIKDPSTNAS